jgi:hypothetical protein
MTRGVPKYAYALALVCSGLAFGVVMVTLLRFGIPKTQGLLTPLLGAGVLGVAFGFLWPRGRPWLWGVWVSSAFWVYFGIVFVALLSIGEPEWVTLAIAVAAMAAGWLGAAAGLRGARVLGRAEPRA